MLSLERTFFFMATYITQAGEFTLQSLGRNLVCSTTISGATVEKKTPQKQDR